MLLSSRALARRVERAEIAFCALAASHEADAVDVRDAGGGCAVFGRPGSPLNKVLGLGLEDPVADADLEAIERFYAAHRAPVAIELCPLAPADLAARLQGRGYVIQGFENELVRELQSADAAATPRPADVRVEVATAPEEWLAAVSEGFAAVEGSDAAPDSSAVAANRALLSAFLHPAIVRYTARIDGSAAGGGAAWTVGDVVGIFGTATRPGFRQRGVQRAVVQRTLDDAAAATLAIATTEPGSTSQRTFERLGFRVLYTRTILVRAA